ncbi:MAG: amino acid transporter, partial [Oceanicoccus sp.]
MKKLLITLILGFMLIPIASPFVMANETSETTEETTEATIVKPLIPKPDFLPGPNSLNIDGSTVSGEDTQNYILNTTIPRVINILLGLFGIGTFLAILFSAVTMLTAWGNEDKVTKAKRNLQYAIIGFLVSLLSYAIVSIIVSLALPSQEVSNQTSFIEYLVPSAYANSIDVNTLFPTEDDLIENQGDG